MPDEQIPDEVENGSYLASDTPPEPEPNALAQTVDPHSGSVS